MDYGNNQEGTRKSFQENVTVTPNILLLAEVFLKLATYLYGAGFGGITESCVRA